MGMKRKVVIPLDDETYYKVRIVQAVMNRELEEHGKEPLDDRMFVTKCLEHYFNELGILGMSEEEMREVLMKKDGE